MKSLWISWLFPILAIIPILPACDGDGNKSKHKVFIFSLVDKTDSPLVEKNYYKALAKVQNPLGLIGTHISEDKKRIVGNINGSGRVIIGPVWDTKQKFSPWVDESLDECSFNDNPIERRREVKNFLEKLNEGIKQSLKSPFGSVKTALIYELDEVSKTFGKIKAEKKILLILSNMMENSDIASFYNSDFISDPQRALKLIKEKHGIPTFDGVNVYVVSSGTVEDRVATLVETFWRLYFRESGANLRVYTTYLAVDLD